MVGDGGTVAHHAGYYLQDGEEPLSQGRLHDWLALPVQDQIWTCVPEPP
jgi:hypothetical protein